ncbi:MAG: outer membrane protein assembly factor BamD [Chthoniobacterales bacterium]
MHDRFSPYFWRLLLAFLLAFPALSPGAVVFRPGKKARYVAPGEENVNANARELFQIAQGAENSGDFGRAMKAYRSLVRRYPKDTLADGAAFQYAALQEKHGDPLKAAEAYRVVVEKYPKSPRFEESIEAQFRIGETFLKGKKVKLFGIPMKGSMDQAIQIFAAIVRTAPYGKYTARAQFNIGLAAEKQGNAESAVAAYTAVSEKFPNDPVAADAQYQIGYLWFKAARSGTYDSKAAASAKIGFQDFLHRYPKSEKVAQARENLRILDQKQTSDAFQIAKFYDKQKNYRAAVIYYNDVIRQQPGSNQSDRAKKRVAQLRAKLGDAVLQSAALTAATAKKAKAVPPPSRHEESSSPMMHTSPDDVAPLPPPEADESLPPPASLTPSTTLAPDVPAAEPSPTPEATASPEP